MNVYPTSSDYKEMTYKTFEEQRKERLHESIDEYLNDGEVDVDLFYKELREGIQNLIDYHDKMKQKAQDGLEAILGHRPIPELDPDPAREPYSIV